MLNPSENILINTWIPWLSIDLFVNDFSKHLSDLSKVPNIFISKELFEKYPFLVNYLENLEYYFLRNLI